MCGQSLPIGKLRRPRRPYLDLRAGGLVGHPPERLAEHRRHGAAWRQVFGAVGRKSVDQPGPADPGQQWIGHHLRIDIGPRKGDAAESALPGSVTGRIVEQDEPAAANLVTVEHHVGGDRRGKRRDPLRRRDLLDNQLRPPGCREQLVSSLAERVWLDGRIGVRSHQMRVWAPTSGPRATRRSTVMEDRREPNRERDPCARSERAPYTVRGFTGGRSQLAVPGRMSPDPPR